MYICHDYTDNASLPDSVIHLICRISARGSRIVCHLLYTHHCKHSLLLGWSFPSLELLLPLSPCFCSSESQLKSGWSLQQDVVWTFPSYRKLREWDATKFHIQLCIALFCMLIVFVCGIDQTHVYGGCMLVSVLIHYFTLVAVMWMGAEAVFMFQKLVIVFSQTTTKYIVTVSLVCWCKRIVEN